MIVAATPIGNLGDASPRLREVLATADVIAAEDTRTLRALASRLDVELSGAVVALHDHNERDESVRLAARASEGATVLLVSDAGMPTVSDPGYRVVAAAIAAGVEVSVVPGPSAVLAALAVSGLPSDRFSFEGFLPRKPGARDGFLAALSHEARTMVFFESPHRIAASLAAMAQAFGPQRRATVSRELTKLHEETMRGTLAGLAERAEQGVRGEIVVVVAGAERAEPTLEDAVAEALAAAAAGERLTEACARIARGSSLTRRDIYDAALAAQSDDA